MYNIIWEHRRLSLMACSSWCSLFSHPADYTQAVELRPEFEKRDVKMIALSIDDEESHKKWFHDIIAYGKT
uniref:AhpC-TSA domain-containing protein n=1 Tax=Strongyloides papillosus TaxID=174720 RepID=A0A0N5CAW2_STREA